MQTHKNIGFAMTGSFCTFQKVVPVINKLTDMNYAVTPIMSKTSSETNTRFGDSLHFKDEITKICKKEIITEIIDAEPIGPKKLLDALIIAPCTGNTLGKLANGITDTAVTMAAKSSLRNNVPVIIAVSTNDALAGSAANIGRLLNNKGYFFVPAAQDDPENKPNSVVAIFELIPETLEAALNNRQIQPILMQTYK